jgi:hypothetical protein
MVITAEAPEESSESSVPAGELKRSIIGSRKHAAKFVMTECEDLEQIRPDEKSMDGPSSNHVVVDQIAAESSSWSVFKDVLMVPPAIRTMCLAVDEAKRRLPRTDQALPANRYAVQRASPHRIQSSILSWISSELPRSSGAYIACARAGRAWKRPGISARRR